MTANRPKIPQVPLPVWRDLLAAALEFRKAQPWQWLDDDMVFALIDDAGCPWYPSVLGAAGQVFGLALYRGEAGLRFVLETTKTLADSPQDALYVQDALLLDWGTKKALGPEELALLAELGHRPQARARQAWPCYRSHSPGWFPWHLNEKEARALTLGIYATLACAELVRTEPDFVAPREQDDSVLPTVSMAAARSGPLQPDQVEWRRWLLSPPAAPAAPIAPVAWLELLQRPKHSSLVLEFDVFHTMMPTLDGDRPYFPRMGLVAHHSSGFIHAMDLAAPDRPWADHVTTVLGKAFSGLKVRPLALAIRRPEWVKALGPPIEKLGIQLRLVPELPMIDEARMAMLQQFGG